jgi:signal transduction histidine kinase
VRARVILGVCATWTLAGLVLAAQSALDVTMRGGVPTPLSVAFIQTLPWIPVTIGVIALTIHVPISRTRWALPLAIHIAAALVASVVANMLIVIGYMSSAGRPVAVGEVIRGGALWGTLHLHITLLIYAGVFAITSAVLYYRQTRSRELQVAKLEGQLARAHLQTLNAQIRPHFLFNTLHTIGQLWRSGRSDDADAVLDHLGNLFHKVQRSTSRFEVPLSEEMELVREYLSIEETRFRDRLQTSVCASEAALDCLVPPLILQPIVENAIRHGISAVSSSGRVDVKADVTDGHLRLSVGDDGPGMAATSTQAGSGTGLRNTRERLAQLYGEDARLIISGVKPRGTLVQLDIPLTPRDEGLRSHD